ncbi:hypothetical protein [Nitrosomonas ureae]|uniref:Uncharacterized protein n=1 Tax=Nitrosomonas ureae TaxID=44577 RepID=A0A1H2F6I4_9PROT|nr:hypothetical protein [Nitrosomonas ureae]SDU02942.1 hypothetical protein SAMN05216406_11825 [Nitrosomonas ureae]
MTTTPDPTQEAAPKKQYNQLGAHRAMVLWLFPATFFVMLGLGAVFIFTDPTLNMTENVRGPSDESPSSVLLFVAISGALGGFVSCLRRLYAFDDIFPHHRYAPRSSNFYLAAYSAIPPLVGIISAAVIYGMFASGLITGELFPKFACAQAGNDCKTLPDFLGYWRPEGAQDYAKAMVWGFISGFSERFFVDTLNQFGGKGATVPGSNGK